MTAAARERRAPESHFPQPGGAPAVTRYDYEWQKPKAAIYVDKTPAVDLVELGQEQEFLAWVKNTLSPLPRFIRQRLASRIDSIHTMKGRHIARLTLRDIIRRDLPPINAVNEQYAIALTDEAKSQADTAFKGLNPLYHTFNTLHGLVERFNRLPDFTPEDVELLAQDIAIYMRSVLSEVHETVETQSDRKYAGYLYTEAAILARLFFLTPPSWGKYCRGVLFIDEATTGISKMLDDRYWHRNLKKYATRWREHLHIAFGDVKRGAAPYCSKHHVDEWDARRKRSRAIMARLELEDQDTKERISLIEQIDKSISNPALRRVELMTRIGGFEKVATESGYAGQFFTLTAPSKYHAYSVFGHRNAKWNGASPRATQRYLNRVWQKIRAELARREIPVFGLRVAESHHDGTPHWHGLLFSLPEHSAELLEVMEDYATREDAEELQGKHGNQPRFDMKPIDHEIGSATGYVVKYISKNIDGYALDGETDDESGRPLKETSKHATAWASCWGIRQFQFLGGAPVSVWRELRRFRNQEQADKINPLFAELHRAADAGDWQQYTQLQGGALVARRKLPLRIWYQQKDQPNDHGEYQNLIKGLVMPHTFLPPIETRLHSYRIVRKKPEIQDDSGQAVDFDFDLPGASAPSRTRVNNCTEAKKRTNPPPGSPPLMTVPADGEEPEQFEIGQLTRDQRKQVFKIIRNYKPPQKKSPTDEFEALAYSIASDDCSEYDTRRAESYLKAAHEIRRQEQVLSPEIAGVAGLVQSWAQVKKIQISKPQAIKLARGNEVTVLDTVYRAHPVTGELIIAGVDKPWRKTLADHKAGDLVTRWKKAAKRKSER
ncbi:replication endonuclease [Klebsiella pneumoniae]|uniref:replication endonuclease n=1 Tax=Klebsiella pneumoniae TaxID=573 RepID=UPI0011BF4ADD|nr:replication endonuclease [Klebsiella pneumoniae]MBK3246135.1 replication endonuclease [Klebsiella pneumoniae]MCJ3731597.1 replication endonuclease [Klebsiella pneumoniae]MCJ3791224.1 replication endonuclease [Klebsiella pneumoniae]MCJ3879715.1 replication endonuclease [Klebsiella pneumoniae]